MVRQFLFWINDSGLVNIIEYLSSHFMSYIPLFKEQPLILCFSSSFKWESIKAFKGQITIRIAFIG